MKLFIAMCVETAIFCLIFYLLWQFTFMDVLEMLWLSGIGGIFGAFLTGALLEGEKDSGQRKLCIPCRNRRKRTGI